MYSYEKEKPAIFTEAGQVGFLQVRDFCAGAIKMAGAVRGQEAMNACKTLHDSWEMMACVDRLVELGELREVTDPSKCAWQHRVFVSKY